MVEKGFELRLKTSALEILVKLKVLVKSTLLIKSGLLGMFRVENFETGIFCGEMEIAFSMAELGLE